MCLLTVVFLTLGSATVMSTTMTDFSLPVTVPLC